MAGGADGACARPRRRDTEILVNPPARPLAAATLALLLMAFAAVVLALRATPPG